MSEKRNGDILPLSEDELEKLADRRGTPEEIEDWLFRLSFHPEQRREYEARISFKSDWEDGLAELEAKRLESTREAAETKPNAKTGKPGEAEGVWHTLVKWLLDFKVSMGLSQKLPVSRLEFAACMLLLIAAIPIVLLCINNAGIESQITEIQPPEEHIRADIAVAVGPGDSLPWIEQGKPDSLVPQTAALHEYKLAFQKIFQDYQKNRIADERIYLEKLEAINNSYNKKLNK